MCGIFASFSDFSIFIQGNMYIKYKQQNVCNKSFYFLNYSLRIISFEHDTLTS